MSDTPRTDAAEVRMERLDGDFDHVVAADFTRTLERELAAATARIAELERLREAWQNDAQTYAQNAEYQRARAESAERDAADAERYRWLRDCAAKQSLYAVMDLSGHKWDEAIDKIREEA